MRRVFIMGLVTITSLFVGCEVSGEVEAEGKKPLKLIHEEYYEYDIYEDTETKVQYILFRDEEEGVSVTPRYNADGSLYINKGE